MLTQACFHTNTQISDPIAADEIAAALFTYPEAHRFIRHATYSTGELKAELVPFSHPFHEPWITHLSREHSITYATQAAYILVALALERGDLAGISPEEYRRACRDEDAHISKVELRFRRQAEVAPGLAIIGNIGRVRFRRRMAFVQCTFDINDIVRIHTWLTCPQRRH